MAENSIESYRSEIADINKEIIDLIHRRTELAEKIGEIKQEQDMQVHQPDQEKKVLSECREYAESVGVDPARIAAIFEIIIAISRNRQVDK